MARSMLQEAYRILSHALGANHPEVMTVVANLAVVHHRNQQYAEAEKLYRRVLAVYEETLGPDHPKVASLMQKYAMLLRETGRAKETREMERRAQAIPSQREPGYS